MIREERFSLPSSLLIACSLFRIQLPFECIHFFKKEGQRLLFRSRFCFKATFFLQFEFGNCSSISLVEDILVTIMIPHPGRLRILRRVAYIIGNR
jgi:hypothetical protein